MNVNTVTRSVGTLQSFDLPPLGKLDPYADYELGDNRPRVSQSAQKGSTCWYYAAMLLGREQFGKKASETLQGRVIEKEISELRKAITRFEEENPLEKKIRSIQLFMSAIRQEPLTVPIVQRWLPDFLDIVRRSPFTNQSEHDFSVLREFCEQEEILNLTDYARELDNNLIKIRIQILKNYLEAKGISPDKEVEKYFHFMVHGGMRAMIHIEGKIGRLMSEATIQQTLKMQLACGPKNDTHYYFGVLHTVIRTDLYAKYNFKVAKWDPCHPVEDLIQSIQNHGRHLVGGRFGSDFYNQPAIETSEKIEGRTVYEWKENPRSSSAIFEERYHLIVVVGARKKIDGTEDVFYVDPVNGTNPDDPTSQFVYKLPYARFLESISCIYGLSTLHLKTPATGGTEKVIIGSRVPSEVTGFYYALHK